MCEAIKETAPWTLAKETAGPILGQLFGKAAQKGQSWRPEKQQGRGYEHQQQMLDHMSPEKKSGKCIQW